MHCSVFPQPTSKPEMASFLPSFRPPTYLNGSGPLRSRTASEKRDRKKQGGVTYAKQTALQSFYHGSPPYFDPFPFVFLVSVLRVIFGLPLMVGHENWRHVTNVLINAS